MTNRQEEARAAIRAAREAREAREREAQRPERTHCPRCGARLHHRHDGIFRWRACPKTKTCGWTVFTHGDDPRDKREETTTP